MGHRYPHHRHPALQCCATPAARPPVSAATRFAPAACPAPIAATAARCKRGARLRTADRCSPTRGTRRKRSRRPERRSGLKRARPRPAPVSVRMAPPPSPIEVFAQAAAPARTAPERPRHPSSPRQALALTWVRFGFRFGLGGGRCARSLLDGGGLIAWLIIWRIDHAHVLGAARARRIKRRQRPTGVAFSIFRAQVGRVLRQFVRCVGERLVRHAGELRDRLLRQRHKVDAQQ